MTTLQFPVPRFDRMTTRASREEFRQRYGLEHFYGMAYNESPLGPSPKAVAAIQAAAAGLGNYPPMGDEPLREKLAAVWGKGLNADNFYTGCSGYETLELVARAFLQPGDEVIVCHPTFGVYNRMTALENAKIVDVPLRQPQFVPDVDAVLAAVTAQTRIVLLCNPNNPTGTIMKTADMDRLVYGLPERVLIVADEVYHHFVTDPDYPDSIRYVLDDKPVVMIQTFSKAYGLAGLRLGYGIARPDIASYIAGLHRGFHQNALNLAAGVAALDDQDHLQKNVTTVLEGKQYLTTEFDRLSLRYLPSQTNFIVVFLPIDSKKTAEKLLAYGVQVRPLGGPGLENSLRISLSVPEGNQAFMHGLEQILNDA